MDEFDTPTEPETRYEWIRKLTAIPLRNAEPLEPTATASTNIPYEELVQAALENMQTAAFDVARALLYDNDKFVTISNMPVLVPSAPNLDVLVEDFNRVTLRVNDGCAAYGAAVLQEESPAISDTLEKELPGLHWRFCTQTEARALFSDMLSPAAADSWGVLNQAQNIVGVTLNNKGHTPLKFLHCRGVCSYNDYEHYAVADVHIASLPRGYNKLFFVLFNGLIPEGLEDEKEILEDLAVLLQKDWVLRELNESGGMDFKPSPELLRAAQMGQIQKLGGVVFTDAAPMTTADTNRAMVQLEQFKSELLSRDRVRADITPYDSRQLEDPNRGNWELWEMETAGYDMIKIDTPLYARDPHADIQPNGLIGIDFGTKSTVVVCQDDTSQIHPVRVGRGSYEKDIRASDYENPTVMEFIDIDSFLSDYQTGRGRPMTHWADLTISHTAFNDWTDNNLTEYYFSFFGDLKQWAEDNDRRVRIRDKQGREISLPAYCELKKGEFDPIELYAYYIGLYINNMHTNRIYMEYLLSFPVTYKQSIRNQILESFRRGLQRSLPDTILKDSTCMERFSVEQGAGEPAAYAVCALQAFHIAPADGERIFYGVFDFGGGTSDFDFGIWRKASGPKERRYRYVIEHFGDSGDLYLGGENLLELLAYHVFRNNRDLLRQKGITFTLPPEQERFPGSETLIADSQEARTNTLNLVEELRPLWEHTEGYQEKYSSGLIKVRLFRNDGQEQTCFELKVNNEELEDILKKRISRGVDAFWDALFENFRKEKLNVKQIHLFLAGNASKSELFKQIFEKQMQESITKMAAEMKKISGENAKDFWILHPPLGTPEAEEQLQAMDIQLDDVDPLERPTGKTGVAIGLLQCRKGSKIKVVDEQKSSEEIRFRYWIGDDFDGYFKSFLSRSTPYRQWVEYLDAGEPYFEFFYTAAPTAGLENRLKISDSSVKKQRLVIPNRAVNEDWTIFIRAVSPNEIEYVVAADQQSADAEKYECLPQSVSLRI